MPFCYAYRRHYCGEQTGVYALRVDRLFIVALWLTYWRGRAENWSILLVS